MQRSSAATALLCALFFMMLGQCCAQTKEEGIAIFNEALKLDDQAKTDEDQKKAIEKYEQALTVFQRVGNKKGQAVTTNNLGNLYNSSESYEKAAEYHQKSLAIERQRANPRGEAITLNNLGIVYESWGKKEKAVEFFQNSLHIFRQFQDTSHEAEVLNHLGNVHRSLGQYEKAVEFYQNSLELARHLRNTQDEGIALNNLGIVYKSWGQNEKAVEYYEKSLALDRQFKNPGGEAKVLGNLGLVYHSWGQNEKALEYFQESLAIERRLNNRAGEASALNYLGLVYQFWRQNEKAVEYYEKSLKLALQINDKNIQVQTLNNLGIVYENWGQYQKAVEYYQESLELARHLKDLEVEARTLNNLGLIYKNWGQHEKAVEYYEKSLAIERQLNDPSGEAGSLNNIGYVYHSWGQNEKAVEYLEKSLALARQINNPEIEAQTLGNLGNVYCSWSRYDKALDYHEKSLAINRRLNNPGGEASCLNNIGTDYYYWGRDKDAIKYYEKSLMLARQLKDPSTEAETLNNLGLVYQVRGQYDRAVDYYQKALAITVELKNPAIEASQTTNLGSVYGLWGHYNKAVECYEKSLAIKRQLNDPSGEAMSLNNLGLVYGALGWHSRALENLETALKHFSDLKDRHREGGALLNIGSVFLQLEKPEEALLYFQKANDIYTEIGVPTKGCKEGIGNVYLDMGQLEKAEPILLDTNYDLSLGRLYLLKRDYPKAKTYYQNARQETEQNRRQDALFASYTGLGEVYEQMGDNKLAEENYRKAVDLTEDVRSSLSQEQKEKFFDVKVFGLLRTAPYDGLARVRLKMGKSTEALKVSEYTKARIFAESMSRRSENASFDITPEVKKQDEVLNNRLSALKKKLREAYEKTDKLVIEVVEPQVKDMEARMQAHIKKLRETYPLFAATKYPQPMDLEQTALKDDELVLEYHVTDPGVIMYLTKGKKLVKAVFKPEPRGNLAKLVLEFRKPFEMVPGKDDLEAKLKSFNFESGKRLSDLLLSEFLDLIPSGAPIVIVPDDCLGTIPFEALTLNNHGSVKTDRELPYVSEAEFFGDRNLISYYQSMTALTLERTHSKGKSALGGLLAIADPVFSAKDKRASSVPTKEDPVGAFASLLKRFHFMGAEGGKDNGGLKFARLELTGKLADTLVKNDKSGSHLCKGFDATKDNFLQNIKPSLKNYNKIVFATHGYFGKDLPGIMEPVLVLTLVPLGTDGFLRMTEVMGLDINAEIIALTACQTGLGTKVSGEGTMGMGRAFQYAGGRSVLMSLWSVSEVASVRLVKSFFDHLKVGKSKPEALNLAKSELRKGIFNHPFFWAAFILEGETN
ncbi:MAG: CHAT domain-containing tetratricopeptide repeat protein [Desulfomonilaceae bacterium]